VKASREIEVPEFDMKTDDGKRARYRYLQEHWLDNTDLSDPCLIRTSLINKKVMTYLEKLTPQIPDSIIQSVDVIIEKASGSEETKRNWLSTLLNKYANSKVIGMDAVYVHLIFNYYAKGDTKPDCAEFITERPGMLKWINVTDPYFRSRYQTIYNVKSTPQIYILDDKNEILIKRIGADQIGEVMEELMIRSENK